MALDPSSLTKTRYQLPHSLGRAHNETDKILRPLEQIHSTARSPFVSKIKVDVYMYRATLAQDTFPRRSWSVSKRVVGMDAWRLRQKKRNAASGASNTSQTSITGEGKCFSNGIAVETGRRKHYSETKHLEEIRNEYIRCVQSWRQSLQNDSLKNSAGNRENSPDVQDVVDRDSEKEKIHREIMEIYAKHNPSKLSDVENLLSQNIGKEAELLMRIKSKYLKPTAVKAALEFPADDAPGQRVFLDFTVNGQPIGQARFLLYDEVVPKTANNFAALCTGEKVLFRRPAPLTPLGICSGNYHSTVLPRMQRP
jgi:hypothetical protein